MLRILNTEVLQYICDKENIGNISKDSFIHGKNAVIRKFH